MEASPKPIIDDDELPIPDVSSEVSSENENDVESKDEDRKSPRGSRGRHVSSEVAALRDALSTEDPVGKRKTRRQDFPFDEFSIPRIGRKKKKEEVKEGKETSKNNAEEVKTVRKAVGKGRGRPSKFSRRKGRGRKKGKSVKDESDDSDDDDDDDDDDEEEIPPGVDPLKRNPEKTKTKILGSIFAMKRPVKPDESRIREGAIVVVKETKDDDEIREQKQEFKSPPAKKVVQKKRSAKAASKSSDSSDVEMTPKKDSSEGCDQKEAALIERVKATPAKNVKSRGTKRAEAKAAAANTTPDIVTPVRSSRRQKLSETSTTATETSETETSSPVRRGRPPIKSESEKSDVAVSEEEPSTRRGRRRGPRLAPEDHAPAEPIIEDSKVTESLSADEKVVEKKEEQDKSEQVTPVRRSRRRASVEEPSKSAESPSTSSSAVVAENSSESEKAKEEQKLEEAAVEEEDKLITPQPPSLPPPPVTPARGRKVRAAVAALPDPKVEPSEPRTRGRRSKSKGGEADVEEAKIDSEVVAAEIKPDSSPQNIVIPLMKRRAKDREAPKVETETEKVVEEPPSTSDNLPEDLPKTEETLPAPVRRGGRRRDISKAQQIEESKVEEALSVEQQSTENVSDVTKAVEIVVVPTSETLNAPTVRLPQLSPQDKAKLKPTAATVVLQQLSPKQMSPAQLASKETLPKQLSPRRVAVEASADDLTKSECEFQAVAAAAVEAAADLSNKVFESVPLKKRRGRISRKSESEQISEIGFVQRPEKIEMPEMSPNSRRGRSASNITQAPAVETIVEEPAPEPVREPVLQVSKQPTEDVRKFSSGFQMENLLRPDVVEVKPVAPPEMTSPEVPTKSRNRRKGNPKKIVEVKYDELDDLSDLDESPVKPVIGTF